MDKPGKMGKTDCGLQLERTFDVFTLFMQNKPNSEPAKFT
jgi:hypothetical protein